MREVGSSSLLAPTIKLGVMPANKSRILILIPAYNAGDYLEELVRRISLAAPGYDILIINDGSSDNTPELLASLKVISLTNDPNRGKGATLQRGFDFALKEGYEAVVALDADLQHLPEEIPLFLAFIGRADLVMGTRHIELKNMPFARWLTNNLTSIMVSIFAGQRVRDSQSGYRIFSRNFLGRLKLKTTRYDYESEMLFQVGLLGAKVGEVPIATVYAGSHSYINPFIDTGRFIRLIWRKLLL